MPLSLDKINHPAHYGGGDNPREAIKVIEGLGLGWGFCLGNCLKYLMRAGEKDSSPLDDLGKAAWYLRRATFLAESNRDPISTTAHRVDPADYVEPPAVVILGPLSGPAQVITGQPALDLVNDATLVVAGSPPIWRSSDGRFWSGFLEGFGLRVPHTPFELKIMLLIERPAPAPTETDQGSAEPCWYPCPPSPTVPR